MDLRRSSRSLLERSAAHLWAAGPALRRCLRLGAVGVMALVVAACSMAASMRVDQSGLGPGCESTAGAYYLSKSFISLKIMKDENDRFYLSNPDFNEQTREADGIAVKARPDPKHAYCLDYLASSTSHDTFEVQKVGHLLGKITSKADDKSQKIAENLIKALFVGLSGNENFDRTARASGRARLAPKLMFQGEFDPLDIVEVARVNQAIREFGFCLFVEGYPVAPTNGDNIGAYCEDPQGYHLRYGWGGGYSDIDRAKGGSPRPAAARPDEPPSYSQGIFYRPRLAQTYYLYVKENLKLRRPSAWRMRATATLLIENASPVLSVGVDRTFFATRETTLEFDSGVLQDVSITKGSELAGFVAIPLQIAQSIAALPANIIQVKINDTNNNQKLIDAQSQLIATQRERNATTRSGGVGGNNNAVPGQGQRSAESNATRSTGGGDAGVTRVASGDKDALGQCFRSCLLTDSEPRCNKKCTCELSCTAGTTEACAAFCQRGPN